MTCSLLFFWTSLLTFDRHILLSIFLILKRRKTWFHFSPDSLRFVKVSLPCFIIRRKICFWTIDFIFFDAIVKSFAKIGFIGILWKIVNGFILYSSNFWLGQILSLFAFRTTFLLDNIDSWSWFFSFHLDLVLYCASRHLW